MPTRRARELFAIVQLAATHGALLGRVVGGAVLRNALGGAFVLADGAAVGDALATAGIVGPVGESHDSGSSASIAAAI